MQGTDAAKYRGTVDCFMQVVKNEGLTGLYSGALPRAYRVVPGQGIIFLTVDTVRPYVASALGRE